MNERLKLLSGNERLMLSPTDGEETLAQATDFFRYIDLFFDGRFGVRVRRFALERVLRAQKRHRLMLRISHSQFTGRVYSILPTGPMAERIRVSLPRSFELQSNRGP